MSDRYRDVFDYKVCRVYVHNLLAKLTASFFFKKLVNTVLFLLSFNPCTEVFEFQYPAGSEEVFFWREDPFQVN